MVPTVGQRASAPLTASNQALAASGFPPEVMRPKANAFPSLFTAYPARVFTAGMLPVLALTNPRPGAASG